MNNVWNFYKESNIAYYQLDLFVIFDYIWQFHISVMSQAKAWFFVAEDGMELLNYGSWPPYRNPISMLNMTNKASTVEVFPLQRAKN